ncbi:MAG: TetR/AcrR family transcriptional regulator [Planctomycetota bacterium]|jgi:AcrR family transcriptional regulator
MGPTSTRKQREIALREELILDTAREMLLERGYLGLTMDRIAEKIEYSKGTVYQHFGSKEDVIVAVAAQANDKRAEFFERAALFHGSTRERVLGIGISVDLFRQLYPSWLRAEQIIHGSSISEKAGDEHMRALYTNENRCFGTFLGIVRDGIAQGDLPADASPEHIVFGLWTMTYGAHFLMSSRMPVEEKIADPAATLRDNQHTLLDGFAWKPFAKDWDYVATEARLLDEVFVEEARQVGLR